MSWNRNQGFKRRSGVHECYQEKSCALHWPGRVRTHSESTSRNLPTAGILPYSFEPANALAAIRGLNGTGACIEHCRRAEAKPQAELPVPVLQVQVKRRWLPERAAAGAVSHLRGHRPFPRAADSGRAGLHTVRARREPEGWQASTTSRCQSDSTRTPSELESPDWPRSSLRPKQPLIGMHDVWSHSLATFVTQFLS